MEQVIHLLFFFIAVYALWERPESQLKPIYIVDSIITLIESQRLTAHRILSQWAALDYRKYQLYGRALPWIH